MVGAKLWGNRKGAGFHGSAVTAVTVVALLVGMAATLLGSAVPQNAIAGFDASAWLWSSPKGELARVNGLTGRVDTRYKVTDGTGRTMQVSQTDRYVIMRDLTTGQISVLDLASLHVAATTESTPGVGITVAVHDDVGFIVDSVQGLVRQFNPATLAPVGQPLRFSPGLGGGSFDASGRLWVLVPKEGMLDAILPAAGAATEARVARAVNVADPDHDISVTTLDDGAAVLDNTAGVLVVVDGPTPRTIKLSLTGPGAMPARTTGSPIPVTVAEDRRVYLVNGDSVADYAVPGSGSQLAPCVTWSRRVYCPDDATGTVYVVDSAGRATGPVVVPSPGGRLELEARERHLFINAPGSSTARVVDKYANNIAGGDPPPAPQVPTPPKPVVTVPGAPGKVTAVAGNRTIRLSWAAAPANGAPIMRYVVEGAGRPVEVSANQRAIDITGLTNGTEYRLTVYAVNAKGAGPKRAANPAIPTAEVPDAPVSATAEARPDGTVAVTWPAANGQGRKVIRYEVTAVTKGAPVPAGESASTDLVVAAGRLTYGTQYAFTVVAVNERGASSAASPLSNTVSPFNKPGAPRNLQTTTVNEKGTVNAAWQPADDNGRVIDHYVVTAGAQRQETKATSIKLSGFGNGELVRVAVRAVNAAGEGAVVQGTATTINTPVLTVAQSGAAAGLNSITVNFTVANRGSPATCTLAIAGGGQATGNCTTLTAGGIWPGRAYAWTLTVANAAGTDSATGSISTGQLTGTVICDDLSYCGHGALRGGIWVYPRPSQNGGAVGDVFSPDEYQTVCQVPDSGGATIDARPWGGKRSNLWVRIRFPAGHENYIPFAWFRLASGDNIGLLPHC